MRRRVTGARDLLRRGRRWDPDGEAEQIGDRFVLQTPTGKFEFYASGLKRLVDEAAARDKTTEPALRALGARKEAAADLIEDR